MLAAPKKGCRSCSVGVTHLSARPCGWWVAIGQVECAGVIYWSVKMRHTGRVEPDGPVRIVMISRTEPREASVMASPTIFDVAVIGGGVSGAYSAWRLKQARPDLKIALFEYSNRIGGRLYTETLPGMPHVHAELGGMRYIPKKQALVDNLIEFLELPTVAFPMGDPKPVGAANNLYYLRQKPIRLSNLTRPGEDSLAT